ncbi:hypothetical protein ACFLYK_04700 [Candidatus Cloacimonadota bacterium]
MFIINTAMKLVMSKTVFSILKGTEIESVLESEIGEYNFKKIKDKLIKIYPLDTDAGSEAFYMELVVNTLLQEDPALQRYTQLYADPALIIDPAYKKFNTALSSHFKTLPLTSMIILSICLLLVL